VVPRAAPRARPVGNIRPILPAGRGGGNSGRRLRFTGAGGGA